MKVQGPGAGDQGSAEGDRRKRDVVMFLCVGIIRAIDGDWARAQSAARLAASAAGSLARKAARRKAVPV
jgi:hypothetical protein